MKSASEIRALMDKGDSMVSRIMVMLEKEIVKAARSGYGFKEVFIPVSKCSYVCAKNVRNKMLDLGYECSVDFIGDQRDGISSGSSSSGREKEDER